MFSIQIHFIDQYFCMNSQVIHIAYNGLIKNGIQTGFFWPWQKDLCCWDISLKTTNANLHKYMYNMS